MYSNTAEEYNNGAPTGDKSQVLPARRLSAIVRNVRSEVVLNVLQIVQRELAIPEAPFASNSATHPVLDDAMFRGSSKDSVLSQKVNYAKVVSVMHRVLRELGVKQKWLTRPLDIILQCQETAKGNCSSCKYDYIFLDKLMLLNFDLANVRDRLDSLSGLDGCSDKKANIETEFSTGLLIETCPESPSSPSTACSPSPGRLGKESRQAKFSDHSLAETCSTLSSTFQVDAGASNAECLQPEAESSPLPFEAEHRAELDRLRSDLRQQRAEFDIERRKAAAAARSCAEQVRLHMEQQELRDAELEQLRSQVAEQARELTDLRARSLEQCSLSLGNVGVPEDAAMLTALEALRSQVAAQSRELVQLKGAKIPSEAEAAMLAELERLRSQVAKQRRGAAQVSTELEELKVQLTPRPRGLSELKPQGEELPDLIKLSAVSCSISQACVQVEVLINKLQDASAWEERRDAVFALIELSNQGIAPEKCRVAAVPAVVQVLKSDQEMMVRTAAAMALGGLVQGQEEQAAPALRKAVNSDAEKKVRVWAAIALFQLGCQRGPEAESLRKLLKDPDLHVRRSAVQALADLGDQGYGERATLLVSTLVHILERDPEPLVCSDAAEALGCIGMNEKSVLSSLANALRDYSLDPAIRANAAQALGRFGELAASQASVILRIVLQAGDPAVRHRAAEALGCLGSEASSKALPALSKALQEGDEAGRRYASEALRGLGDQALPVVPVLIQSAFLEQEVHICRNIVHTLGNMNEETAVKASKAFEQRILSSADYKVRKKALELMVYLGEKVTAEKSRKI